MAPVVARSGAWICGRSLAGVAGSNPGGGMDACLVRVMFQVEDPAMGRSLVQRSPTYCGVPDCYQVQQ